MSRLAPGKAERLIAQFEAAADDYANLGSIPVYGQDREEQEVLDRERTRIKTAYTKTRNRLLKAMETD